MSIRVVASPTQLSWSDFAPVNALPDASGEEAQTATKMTPLSGIRPVSSQGQFSLPDLTLTVSLDRAQTLVIRTAHKTDELLKHEQGHYDITVLTIRALGRELEQLSVDSPHELGQQVMDAVSKHQKRADALEQKYEDDTHGSRNQDAQNTWNQAIDAAMKGKDVATLQGMWL